MIRKHYYCCWAGLLVLSLACSDSTGPAPVTTSTPTPVTATVPPLTYDVFVPEDLAGKKDSVSLLVVLDGGEYSGIARNTAVLYEFGEKIYPTVVVSIPSTPISRWAYFTPTHLAADENDTGNQALYPYTGRFGALADFLEQQVLPELAQKYDLQFYQKTLFGHSMGGLAVLSFIVLRPEVFDHYIAASPSTMYDDHYLFRTIEDRTERLAFKSLFLTAARHDSNGYRENVNWLNEYLQKAKPAAQRLELRIYERETHATSGVKSLIDGLEFVGKNG